MSQKISVLVNTLNEEANIRNCLECVKWADEIVVVDMYSEDRTLDIAREYTDKVFLHERVDYVEPARRYALEQATNEWVLVVDADELVTRELRDRILQIAEEDRYDVVYVPRINYFFGRAMRGTGWAPLQDMHVRFFKKWCVRYSDEIHSPVGVDPSARVYELLDESCAFVHFNYIDAEHFIDKLNRYTTIEAKNSAAAGRSFSGLGVLYAVLKEVGWRFFLKNGFKDGFQGLALSLLMGFYRLSAGLKLYLMERYSTENVRDTVLKQYARIAEREIRRYEQS
ncbi:glycosyl transferase, family 2 [Rubrobacter xylanophilus DSM 9941]|uniref:Glycosyl transferase, family 2 n=1 Tax=Rubrobacter xylanophilus (strain DSM 9941 / JCM 11954 / NBRC 16129 / PRD-1) TaxID=266117 RepID=Q1AYJ1_RUBXD|nr:glycosyltransferase family 2 protein [Rubrobacter xylanophilus]ABG03537.1 glycosyl transferase, family 2 [Rubrobacter xylanophilus DSM 9941]